MFPYTGTASRCLCGFKNGELTELPRVIGGVDWGARFQVVYRNGSWLLVKVPGHTAWSGIGRTRYYGTSYMVVEITAETEDEYALTFYKNEDVVDNNWRDIRKRLKVEIDNENN